MSSVLKEFRSVKGFNREMEPSSFHQSEQNIGKYNVYAQGWGGGWGGVALPLPLGYKINGFSQIFPTILLIFKKCHFKISKISEATFPIFLGIKLEKNEELIIFFLDEVDTAIFYSITSTQLGLQGIELGNHLIKQVTNGVDIYW